MSAGSSGRFYNIISSFSNRSKMMIAGFAGSSLFTYLWTDSLQNRAAADELFEKGDRDVDSLVTKAPKNPNEIEDGSANVKQLSFHKGLQLLTYSGKYNKRFKEVVPHIFEIIHQAKECCGAPGISFAITHDGEMVMHGGIGLADVENNVLCTSETVLRIASISKSLTSIAVASLIEKDLIDLNEPVQTYVPSFPEKKFNGDSVTITTKQLLSHTSGIRGYFEGDGEKDDKAKRKHEIEKLKYGEDCNNSDENFITEHFQNVEAGLALFKDDPLLFKPGTDYEYSSLAYSLISRIIEKVSGKDYVTYMKSICRDIGMNHTKIDLNDPIVYKRARNYKREDGKLKNVPYVDNSYKWSGGGFLSNVNDLAKLGNILLYSFQSDEGYLKQSSVQTLWNIDHVTVGKASKCLPHVGYALGWFVNPKGVNNELAVYHTGGAVGASSVLLIVPDGGSDSSVVSSNGYPKGTVIAIIVNMHHSSLQEAACRIATYLQDVQLHGAFKRQKF